MLEWIVSLGSWNWFILAALLLLIEILAPGMFMLWLGLSAILVGIISSAVVWSWQARLIAFAVFAIAAVAVVLLNRKAMLTRDQAVTDVLYPGDEPTPRRYP